MCALKILRFLSHINVPSLTKGDFHRFHSHRIGCCQEACGAMMHYTKNFRDIGYRYIGDIFYYFILLQEKLIPADDCV